MDLKFTTLKNASKLLESKQISSVELTQHYIDTIEQKEGDLHAFVTVTKDEALAAANRSDERRNAGKALGMLDGIPGALKDVFTTKGVRSTASSKMLDNFKPPYDAHVTELLNDAGSVIVGKTNLDEFAMGTTTVNSAYGITTNPWDATRAAGGSSGGSAAAVAADESLFALGTDTGGSIRLPASWTGTVGLRPTYGRVSRNGIIAMASSLDQVGTFTRSVEDAAYLLECIAEPDKNDSTSVQRPVGNYTAQMRTDLQGMTVGVVKEFFGEGVDGPVKTTVHTAIDQLQKLGANIKEVSLPLATLSLATYCIIVPAEVSTNLERYDGIRYGYSAMDKPDVKDLIDVYLQSRAAFGAEAKRRTMLGAFVLSAGYYDAYYRKAQKVRALITKQFEHAFKDVDVLVGPVAPTTAFTIGENLNDPLKMWMLDVLAVPVNIAGLPGISVPCGMVEGLPVGLQIIASQFNEEKIFNVASAFEASTQWHTMHPEGK